MERKSETDYHISQGSIVAVALIVMVAAFLGAQSERAAAQSDAKPEPGISGDLWKRCPGPACPGMSPPVPKTPELGEAGAVIILDSRGLAKEMQKQHFELKGMQRK